MPIRYRDFLNLGDCLGPEEGIVSPDGRFEMVMQGDGNLVTYSRGIFGLAEAKSPRWSTNTQGRAAGASLCLELDGNVRLRRGNEVFWETGTGVKVVGPDGTDITGQAMLWKAEQQAASAAAAGVAVSRGESQLTSDQIRQMKIEAERARLEAKAKADAAAKKQAAIDARRNDRESSRGGRK